MSARTVSKQSYSGLTQTKPNPENAENAGDTAIHNPAQGFRVYAPGTLDHTTPL